MTKFIVGHTSGMTGHSHTEASKRKMSEAHRGQVPWNKDKKTTPEMRENMCVAQKEVWLRPGYREKMSKAHVGKAQSEDTVKKRALALLGHHHTQESKDNMSKAQMGRQFSQETKDKMSIKAKHNWSDPAYAKRMLSRRTPSGAEVAFGTFLKDNGFEYQYVGNGEVWFGGKNPDFINTNGLKKLIELWGDFFHKGDNPQDRIDHFKAYGFDTLIVWASELGLRYRVGQIRGVSKQATLKLLIKIQEFEGAVA